MKRLAFIALVVFVSAFGTPYVVETGEFSNEIVMSDPVNISNSPTEMCQYESVSIDSAGSINVAWVNHWLGEVHFSRSTDGGSTFNEPIIVMPYAPEYSYSQVDVVGTDKDIHITFTAFEVLITGNGEIAYSRSTDGGATFEDPFIVSNVDLRSSYVPSIASDGDNLIEIVWSDDNYYVPELEPNVSLSRSVDKGKTFSPPMILVEAPNPGEPDIAIDSENIYVVSTYGPAFEQEILFSRSIDGGITFFPPINISNSPEMSWPPVITVDSAGNIYIIWAEGIAGNLRLFFARSTDEGNSFSSPLLLPAPEGNADCYSIASIDDGKVYIALSIFDFPVWSIKSYLVWSSDKGASFSNPHLIPPESEESGCPQIAAMEDNQIGLVWHHSNDIFFSRGEVPIPSSKAMPWIPLLLLDD